MSASNIHTNSADLKECISEIHALAWMDGQVFSTKVQPWLGRAFVLQASNLHDCEGGSLKMLRSELKMVRERLKCLPLEMGAKPRVKELKDLRANVKVKKRVCDFTDKIVKLADIDLNQTVFDRLVAKNHIEVTNDYTLNFSDALGHDLNDDDLERILTVGGNFLSYRSVRSFDLTKYPRLGLRAPLVILQAFPSIDRSYLQAIEVSTRFQNHTLIVQGQKFSVNRELFAFKSRYLQTMWSSGMKEAQFPEGEQPTTTLQECNPEAFADCLDYLYGRYSIAKEEDQARSHSPWQNCLSFFQRTCS